MRFGRELCADHHVVGPRERQVAEEDRGRYPELLGGARPAVLAVQRGELHVDGRFAPPGRGAVDDVIVDERAGVEKFQRGTYPENFGVPRVWVVGDRAPAPVGECRAQPLTAAQHKPVQGGDGVLIVLPDVRGVLAAFGQELA
ncbi:Uncharacterised protein [Mycobacteroides abscessus subsp. abscessus]|nr:Uncharacterised protein [Mycobacteroides abscessus subsp. abscessus]